MRNTTGTFFFKNLVDEKVAVFIVEFLLDLYALCVSETSKGDSCLGTLKENMHHPPVCLSVQENSILLQGRCWLSETGNLEFCYSVSACLSPNRLTMNANQTNYPCFWKDCTNGLHIETGLCIFLILCVA